MKRHYKQLFASILIAASSCVISVGTTFALFTDKAETTISIESGKVDVNFAISNPTLTSADYNASVKTMIDENSAEYGTQSGWVNGGEADISNSIISLSKMTPGDKADFNLTFSNSSNVTIKYRCFVRAENESDKLLEGLEVGIGNDSYLALKRYYSSWKVANVGDELDAFSKLSFFMPITTGDDYQNLATRYVVGIEAVQGNAHVVDDENLIVTHDYDLTTYEWNNDNTKLTARRICKADHNHNETETVNVTSEVLNEPTCTAKGTKKYTSAAFSNPVFEVQTKTVDIDELGHNFAAPTYEWNTDYSECTATRVCMNDANHIETEVVSSTSTVTQQQSCTNVELTRYVATFENSAFVEQVVNDVETKAALGHDLIHHDAQAATCEEAGWNAYDTCSRCEYSTYEEIAALGHDYSVVYSWTNPETGAITKTVVCSHDSSHILSEETEELTSNLTVSSSDTTIGTVEVTNGYGLEPGESITVKANAGENATFNGWYSDSSFNTLVSTENPYSFVMPSGSYHLYAKFEESIPGASPVFVNYSSITFGMYPQYAVSDDLSTELNTAKGNGAITKNNTTGYYLYNGSYYAQGANESWYKCSAITWRVLSHTGNDYFVISSSGLDAHRFDSNTNVWANSELKTWLGSTFKNAAFTLVNSGFESSIATLTLPTKDEVEAKKYTIGNIHPTPYAVANGSTNSFYGTRMWTQTQGADKVTYYNNVPGVYVLDNNLDLSKNGPIVITDINVRPCMHIYLQN